MDTGLRGVIKISDRGVDLKYTVKASRSTVPLTPKPLSYTVLLDENWRAIKMGKDAKDEYDGYSGELKNKMFLFKDIYRPLFDGENTGNAGSHDANMYKATDGSTVEKSTVIAAAFDYVQDL